MSEKKYQKAIGTRIAELRQQKGITQQELADRTGILRNNISRIEAGFYDTKISTICRIVEVMGCKFRIE